MPDLALGTVNSLFGSCSCHGRLRSIHSVRDPIASLGEHIPIGRHAHTYRHPPTDANGNSHAYPSTYQHSPTNANGNSHAYPSTHQYSPTDANGNSHAYPSTYQHSYAYVGFVTRRSVCANIPFSAIH